MVKFTQTYSIVSVLVGGKARHAVTRSSKDIAL